MEVIQTGGPLFGGPETTGLHRLGKESLYGGGMETAPHGNPPN